MAIAESLDEQMLSLERQDAARLGLTWDEYLALSKTVKPEDTVDEAMILPNMLKSKG